jgi:hypothetical protein
MSKRLRPKQVGRLDETHNVIYQLLSDGALVVVGLEGCLDCRPARLYEDFHFILMRQVVEVV